MVTDNNYAIFPPFFGLYCHYNDVILKIKLWHPGVLCLLKAKKFKILHNTNMQFYELSWYCKWQLQEIVLKTKLKYTAMNMWKFKTVIYWWSVCHCLDINKVRSFQCLVNCEILPIFLVLLRDISTIGLLLSNSTLTI